MARGKLIICSTPIGNLGDVTVRVLDALRSADVVCAEDTRVTSKLLAAYDISKRIERLDEARISTCTDEIIDRIAAGEVVAYCSDAGMPGVSDPGLRLIKAARDANLSVEVLPGASSLICAYVASGITAEQFYFGGFFPRKAAANTLIRLRTLDAALVFYESPKRLVATLDIIARTFPMREVAVCRELTKIHEEIVRDLAPRVLDEFRMRCEVGAIKGEIVIVIDKPAESEALDDMQNARDAAGEQAASMAQDGVRMREITTRLADEFDLGRNDAYEIALNAVKAVQATDCSPQKNKQ